MYAANGGRDDPEEGRASQTDYIVLPRVADTQLNAMTGSGYALNYDWMFHHGETHVNQEVIISPSPSGSKRCTHHGTQLPSLARVAQGWANAEEADIGYQEYVLARDGGLIYELYPFFNGPDPEALDRMVSSLS